MPPETTLLGQRQSCRLIQSPRRREAELGADCVGGLEVDDELEFHGLLDRKIRGLGSVEYSLHRGRADERSRSGPCRTTSVHRLDIGLEDEHGGQSLCDRQVGNMHAVRREERTGQHEQHLRRAAGKRAKRGLEIVRRIFEFP